MRFGVRDYDAHIGRWTAKDPILFAGGTTSEAGAALRLCELSAIRASRTSRASGVSRPSSRTRDQRVVVANDLIGPQTKLRVGIIGCGAKDIAAPRQQIDIGLVACRQTINNMIKKARTPISSRPDQRIMIGTPILLLGNIGP